MKFEDNNNNEEGVFSYFGENENELNNNLEKLMSENKKPIYNSNNNDSIFTSQTSFKQYSNVHNLRVVSKKRKAEVEKEAYTQHEELEDSNIQELDHEHSFGGSTYKQSSYLNELDFIDEPDETYEDIKNDITRTTQTNFGDFEPIDDKTSFGANNNYHKSYSQIPNYAQKPNASKSSKDNHRNSLVNDIINRHKAEIYNQDASSSSMNHRIDSGIKSIPLNEISNVTHHIETKKSSEEKPKSPFEDVQLPKISKETNLKNKNKKVNKSPAKVIEFSKEKPKKNPKPIIQEPIENVENDEHVPGFNPKIKVKTQRKKADPKQVNYDNVALIAKIVAAAMGVTLILGILFYLFIGVDVKQITIVGDSIYSDSEIIEAVGIDITDNILRVSVTKLEKALVKDLAYLGEVDVQKSTSDGLTIEIISTTTDQILFEITDSTYVSVDENLKILSIGQSNIDGAYLVIGVDAIETPEIGETLKAVDNDEYSDEEIKIDIALELASQLDNCEINADVYIDVSNCSQVMVYYNDLIEIRMGDVLYPQNLELAINVINSSEKNSSGYIFANSDGLTVNLQ